MIDRILNANVSIPLKKLEDDYMKHLQIKKNIQKSQFFPVEQMMKKKKQHLQEVESNLFPILASSMDMTSKKGGGDEKKKRSASDNKNNFKDPSHGEERGIQQRQSREN